MAYESRLETHDQKQTKVKGLLSAENLSFTKAKLKILLSLSKARRNGFILLGAFIIGGITVGVLQVTSNKNNDNDVTRNQE